MAGAFQADAFQNDAFQVDGGGGSTDNFSGFYSFALLAFFDGFSGADGGAPATVDIYIPVFRPRRGR